MAELVVLDAQNHPMKRGETACHFRKHQGSKQLVDGRFVSGRESALSWRAFHLGVTQLELVASLS